MKPTIKFEALADLSTPLSRQLVCTIWPLDDSEQSASAEPIVENRPILVGSMNSQPEESEVNLPMPGNYLVDLGFPNGRRTRRAVSVTGNEPYRFVIHESRYASNGTGSPPPTPSFFSDMPRVVMSAARSIVSPSHSELEVSLTIAPNLPRRTGLKELRAFFKDLEHERSTVIKRERGAELTHTIVLDATRHCPNLEFQSTPHRRAWLLVSGRGKDTTIVPYPSGWNSESGEESFLLTVRRNAATGDEATKWSVSLQLRDPSYGSFLSFLTRRDLQASAAISGTVRTAALTALYQKQMNPYAAAMGAYMLALGDNDEHIEQTNWISNLTERFPWLPDGPIAQGYRLLRRTEKGREQFEQARRLIFKAVDRGLPYFTIGLTLLTEALNFLVLANPSDSEAKGHLAAAISAQMACVRDEPFCTLQTSRFYRLPEGPNGSA